MKSFDIIIVGAGHNGLTAAAYLAKSGLSVLLIERRPLVGGAAVTEALHPGYRFSRGSYLPHLREEIIKELKLDTFGYKQHLIDPKGFYPFENGKFLFFYNDPHKTSKEIEKFSKRDAKQYLKFREKCRLLSETIDPLILSPPPSLSSLLTLLEGDQMDDIIRQFLLTSVSSLVNELFESEELKTALCLNSVGNTSLGPDSVGTSYLLALSEGGLGYCVAQGGTGAVSAALEKAAVSFGAKILTDKQVKRITIEDDRVKGVELESGEVIEASKVISNADPKTTILKLTGREYFETDFIKKVENISNMGSQTKINIAVKGLPQFRCVNSGTKGPQHLAYTSIADSVETLRKAHAYSTMGQIPEKFPIYSFMQSGWDETVAPRGCNTLSILLRYTPYRLSGSNWDEKRIELGERFLSAFENYVVDFKKSIEFMEILTPWDVEQLFGMNQGHVSHIEQSLDQLLSFRPIIGWSHYRLPVDGLYLCGAGTHPGGGVMGAAGHNAAMVVQEDLKK